MFNRCFLQFAPVIQILTLWFLCIERSMVCSNKVTLVYDNKPHELAFQTLIYIIIILLLMGQVFRGKPLGLLLHRVLCKVLSRVLWRSLAGCASAKCGGEVRQRCCAECGGKVPQRCCAGCAQCCAKCGGEVRQRCCAVAKSGTGAAQGVHSAVSAVAKPATVLRRVRKVLPTTEIQPPALTNKALSKVLSKVLRVLSRVQWRSLAKVLCRVLYGPRHVAQSAVQGAMAKSSKGAVQGAVRAAACCAKCCPRRGGEVWQGRCAACCP